MSFTTKKNKGWKLPLLHMQTFVKLLPDVMYDTEDIAVNKTAKVFF